MLFAQVSSLYVNVFLPRRSENTDWKALEQNDETPWACRGGGARFEKNRRKKVFLQKKINKKQLCDSSGRQCKTSRKADGKNRGAPEELQKTANAFCHSQGYKSRLRVQMYYLPLSRECLQLHRQPRRGRKGETKETEHIKKEIQIC